MRLFQHFMGIATALLMTGLITAGTTYAGVPGGEALPFIRLERSGIGAAMGGAGVASTSSTSFASFKNAAVIPFSESEFNFEASWLHWMPKENPSEYFSFGESCKLGRFGLGLGFSYGIGKALSYIDFTPSDIQVSGSVAYKMTDWLAMGVNLGFASSQLTKDFSLSAFCTDIFLTGTYEGLNVALGISSLGSKAGKESNIPTSGTLGLAYPIALGGAHILEVCTDADIWFSGTVTATAGLQYSYNDLIFVRCGGRYGGESIIPGYASAGLGIKYKGLNLNLAGLFASEVLGNSLSISLGYSF